MGRIAGGVSDPAALTFLEPWRAVLKQVVVSVNSFYLQRDSIGRVGALMRCWPTPRYELSFRDPSLYFTVRLPTNHEKTRQQIREALELFNLLAAINAQVFVSLLAELFTDAFDLRQARNYKAVCPVWSLWLTGTLDSVAKQTSATWGDLFGCAEDPWVHSSSFRAAMRKLKKLSQLVERSWWGLNASIEWTADHQAISTAGWQVYNEGNEPIRADTFWRKLGELLDVDVPPVVHMSAVTDGARLVEEWRQTPHDECDGLTGSMWIWKTNFAALGIQDMTVALLRAVTERLWLRIDQSDFGRRDEDKPCLVNAGFLLNVAISGWLPLVDPGNVVDVPQRKFSKLGVVCSDFKAASTYSALAEATSIDHLVFGRNKKDKRVLLAGPVVWNWLAYALFSQASNASIKEVDAPYCLLEDGDVADVAAVMKTNYPEPVREVPDTTNPPRYGFVNVPAGTELMLGDGDETSLILSRDCRCRALYNPAAVEDSVNVVVPAYGICKMKLDGVNQFERDGPTGIDVDASRLGGVGSLKLTFKDLGRNPQVTTLLTHIGRNLRTLSMSMSGGYCQVFVGLNDIAVACPHLEELRIYGFDVSISRHRSVKELQEWGIKKLVFGGGSERISMLTGMLKDPRFRMSRELTELEIEVQHNTSHHYVDALDALDEVVLPVVKDKFPLKAKVAMISAVTKRSGAGISRLDANMLSVIFGFAAIPAQRSVRVKFQDDPDDLW